TAVLLVEQGAEHVGRLHELVVAADGQGLGIGKGRLESAGEFVHSHRPPKWGSGADLSIGSGPYMRSVGLAFGEGDEGDAKAYQEHLGDAGARVDLAVQSRDEVGHS